MPGRCGSLATGYNGDLDVTITESDGREKYIRIPYTSQPRLVRQGQTRFNLSLGQIREWNVKERPWIALGTLQYGLSNALTLYGGATGGASYASLMSGVAVNSRAGAFALDVTGARAKLPFGGSRRGMSTRLSYSKQLEESRTNVGIAAYRFNSSGYLGVIEAVRMRSDIKSGRDPSRLDRERNRLDLTVSQPLGDRWGQLSVSASQVRFWSDRSRRLDYTLGYTNHWGRVSYNLQAQRSQLGGDAVPQGRPVADQRRDTSVYLMISIPLSRAVRAPNFTGSVNHRNGAPVNYQAGINGTFGDESEGTYGLTAGHSGGQQGTNTGSASIGYRAPLAVLSASVGRSTRGPTQMSVGASGSVVAHRHGITFSQELGETNAIIHAPGARGARIESRTGLRLDRWGNAVVSNLNPYQLNEVAVEGIASSS